jgi:hypothetical protein
MKNGVRGFFTSAFDARKKGLFLEPSQLKSVRSAYSITWSARTSIDCGSVMDWARAAFRLITSSIFTG